MTALAPRATEPRPAERWTRRALLGRLGLAAGGAVVGGGAAEVLARVLAPARAPIRLSQFTDLIADKYALRFDDVFRPDPETFWRLAPDVVLPDDAWPLPGRISNREGLREEHELGPKRAGALRVLCLGDSCTFGYALPHTAAWVEQCERLVAARLGPEAVECVNAGVPGYTLFQGWRLLETAARAWRPDAVVLSFGWNGMISWDGIGDLEHWTRTRATTPPGPLAASRLLQLGWQALGSSRREADASGGRPRLLPWEFRDLLGRVDASARARGFDALALVWPSEEATFGPTPRPTPLQAELIRWGAERRFGPDGAPALVDGVAAMAAAAAREPGARLYVDAIHASAAGSAVIANAVAERLLPWAAARRSAGRS